VCVKQSPSSALLCYTADPNQCPYGIFALILFACYKKIVQKSSLCTPPNVVTLSWASMLYLKKLNEQGLAHYTHKQYPCAIIEHIANVYLKLVAD